ncbi:MAG: dihydropyrimidinase [Oscillospiraceae bacterium]
MSHVLKNGTLVLPTGLKRADLLLENGKIAQMGPNLTGDTLLDCTGKLIFPGFIDTHTHFDMNKGLPNQTADDFATGTAAAVVGGTTSILDFSCQDKGHTLMEAVDTWHSRADGVSSCHYGFHMSILDWNEETRKELPLMTREGVTSYKLYFAYDNLRVSDAVAYEVISAVAQEGGIVGNHCENGDLVNEGIRRELALGHLSPAAHPHARPDYVEAEAVCRWLSISEAAGVPVNIVHLSTKRGLNLVREARARGQKFYVESCPQYLLLNDDKYLLPGFESAKFVLSPPLRAKADSDALWSALTDGNIDTIGTDHCSFNFDGVKTLGRDNFSKIPNGIPGTEHRPALLYTYGVGGGHITEVQLCKLLAENPAKLFGMYPQKGVLAVGSDADLVVWDPAARWTISAQNQVQNVDYTPYEGTEVTGRADTVFLNGTPVVEHGKLTSQNKGQYLKRHAVNFWR